MLKQVLLDVQREGGQKFEYAFQVLWPKLLPHDDKQRTPLCDDIAQHLQREVAKGAASATLNVSTIFTNIALAVVYAIHAGFAPPVSWTVARLGPFRPPAPAAQPTPSSVAAAQLLVDFCEKHLLPSAEAAQSVLRQMLQGTAAGVPFLAVVLRAYGEAVVNVLARQQSSDVSRAPAVHRCLNTLYLATHSLTTGDEGVTLTIAHPIFLHVARVTGCVPAAMQVFQQPVHSVNPMLTGVGLADYVGYYAEAALLLAGQGLYESALFALAPVSLLPATRGVSERESGFARDGGEPAWLAGLEDEEAAGGRGGWRGDDGARSRERVAVVPAPSAAAAVDALVAFPWYRFERVGAKREYVGYTESKDGGAERFIVQWRDTLVPSPVEWAVDQRTVDWANRLGLVLLAAAFGGGSPRALMDMSREVVSSAAGTQSAIDGHVCFPHPLWGPLTEATPLSLHGLARSASDSKGRPTSASAALLFAVAGRDAAAARQHLGSMEFANDLTQSIAAAAVASRLPRHTLLDVVRLYAHVPLQLLLSRTQLGVAATDGATEDNAGLVKPSRERALVQLLADMCTAGELATCEVCVSSGATTTGYPAVTLAARLREEADSISLSSATVRWTLPSSVATLHRAALVVRLQPQSALPEANPDSALVNMLARLQPMERTVKRDVAAVLSMRDT